MDSLVHFQLYLLLLIRLAITTFHFTPPHDLLRQLEPAYFDSIQLVVDFLQAFLNVFSQIILVKFPLSFTEHYLDCEMTNFATFVHLSDFDLQFVLLSPTTSTCLLPLRSSLATDLYRWRYLSKSSTVASSENLSKKVFR